MSSESRAFYEGLKKSDLKKLNNSAGCEWADYHDLDFWLLEDEDDHEPLDVQNGKALLSAKVLRKLRAVISDDGFGNNPDIDDKHKERTLSFIEDALLAIRLGGQVFYQSEDMSSGSGPTSTDSSSQVADAKTAAIMNAASQLKAAGKPISPAVIIAIVAKQGFMVSSSQVSNVFRQQGLATKKRR